jgi:hypothetical protein
MYIVSKGVYDHIQEMSYLSDLRAHGSAIAIMQDYLEELQRRGKRYMYFVIYY